MGAERRRVKFGASKPGDPARKLCGIAGFAFPYGARGPAQLFQRGGRRCVAGHVAGDLGLPVGAVGLRHAGAARTVVAVPEAAVHEEGDAAGGEDEVRLAGQVGAVEAEAQAERVGGAADGEFGRGVLRLHRAHHGGALRGVEDVGHRLRVRGSCSELAERRAPESIVRERTIMAS